MEAGQLLEELFRAALCGNEFRSGTRGSLLIKSHFVSYYALSGLSI